MSAEHRCRKANGSPKVRYATRSEARRAARLTSLDWPGLSAYHCPDCGYFHIGHRPSEAEIRATVTVIQADGTQLSVIGQTGTVDVDPCWCGLAREFVQTELDGGWVESSWACADHG